MRTLAITHPVALKMFDRKVRAYAFELQRVPDRLE